MELSKLVYRGFSCPNCSDSISIPEKYMSNILYSVNCNYEYQLSRVDFEWIGKYKYDFYLTDYNIVIETHGEQHYRDRGRNSKWYNLEKVQSNDTDKLKLAQKNGYELNKNYFVIDCSSTDFKFLTEQIKHTLDIIGELYNINFSNVNYKECYIKSQTSVFYLVVQIANNNPEFTYQEIADKLKEKHGYQLKRQTIGCYLKKSNDLGFTNYKNKNKRMVICLNTGKIYESARQASIQTAVTRRNICACCRGKQKSAGKLNGEKLVWMYYDEYLESL